MAITENKQYIVVPAEYGWGNFRVEHDGKYIFIWGTDGKTYDNDIFGERILSKSLYVTIEQHRTDLAIWKIVDEDGTGPNGGRYLILKRFEYPDPEK